MNRFLLTFLHAILITGLTMDLAAQRNNAETPESKAGGSKLLSDALNKNLPRWLRFTGEYRSRLEGFTGGGFHTDNEDFYLLHRLRLNMSIQPIGWLKFYFQGQDARVFSKNSAPYGPPFQDIMDLRMAYVELGDVEKRATGFRVGRQELLFGERRLVGHGGWLNTARSFDAVRATVHHNGYRVDAFATSVVNIRDGKFNESAAGDNLHGLYGAIDHLVPKAVLEPYVLWRLAPRLKTELGTMANLDLKTFGFRYVGKLPANFDYNTEVARQIGSVGTDDIGAWAGHWLIGCTVTRAPYQPRLIIEYNYASGDRAPLDGKRGTFDQLYPTAHDKYGLADQVGWRNIHHVRSGFEFRPNPKWLMMGNYHSWWLASARDGLYNAGGVLIAQVADGSAGRHVGQELDFQAVYSLQKQIQVSGGYAYLFPGNFLQKATPGKPYHFPYLMLNYVF
ncbi:MAG: alginate export family protein [Acidobacteria bacterium]|nr:alginate export family protein [Acidobacteriota bacterium]